MSVLFGLRLSRALSLPSAALLGWLAAGPIPVRAEVVIVKGGYGVNPGVDGARPRVSPPPSTKFAAPARYAVTGPEGEGGRS